MTTEEIKRLIIIRRRDCGIGLCGSYAAIARWLYREHGVIATEAWICEVVKQEGTNNAVRSA